MDDFETLLIYCGFGAVGLLILIYATPYILVLGGSFVGYHLWKNNPTRLEAVARRHTQDLYKRSIAISHPDFNPYIELDKLIDKSVPDATHTLLVEIGVDLFYEEGISPDIPEPPTLCNSIEGGRYRDMLAKIGPADMSVQKAAISIIASVLNIVGRYAPDLESDVLVDIKNYIDDIPRCVGSIIDEVIEDNDYGLFKDLIRILERNFEDNKHVYPVDYKGDDVVNAYFRGTHLERLFEVAAPFGVPEYLRYEHTWMVAGTGHGKTQVMQYHIAKDLEDLGTKSIVVIDSQEAMIPLLMQLDIPKEQVVLIDPRDINFPVALNLFSAGQERLDQYDALAKEQLENSIIELLEFVLSSLMGASMTGQQSIIFRYTIRLMLIIPNATIQTFLEVLEDNGTEQYGDYMDQLEGTSKKFFQGQFDDPEFRRMRKAVVRRLYLILENKTLERMFANPESKLDLFSELNKGKLILINTSKATIKETGTQTFGRFFLALIAQASAERAQIPKAERTPTIVYVDEAHEYLDRSVKVMLEQARKQNIGLFVAHQELNQLPSGLRQALASNTSIKMAGGTSNADAKALTGDLNCAADVIQHQPKGHFATYLKGKTKQAVSVNFPFFILEKQDKRSELEQEEFIAYQREMYARPKFEGDVPERGAPPEVDDEGFPLEESQDKDSIGFKLKPKPRKAKIDPDDVDESGDWAP